MQYRNFPINTGVNNQYAMNYEMLDEIIDRFEYMTSRLSQVFIIRFDLHFPDTNTSSIDPLDHGKKVSRFFNELVQKKLKRGKKKHNHVQYFWVREVEKSKKGHYHCFLMVDKHKLDKVGSLTNHRGIYGFMAMKWTKISNGGTLSISPNALNGLVVINQLEKDSAIYALSYLAKQRGKNVRHGTSVRNYGGSKIPHRTPQPELDEVA